MRSKCAIFSCLGLGDGLIALVLSNNLSINGHSVTTFHPSLSQLQTWFPHLPLRDFPSEEEMDAILSQFDQYFIIFEKSPWMQRVIEWCKIHRPNQTKILNPIATPNKDYPYWEVGKFDGTLPFVENLYRFCSNELGLAHPTHSNGIHIPASIHPRQYPNRIVIHPTSSRPGKNWSMDKFVDLARQIQKRGFDPVFILTEKEKEGWPHNQIKAPHFSSLSEVAEFVAQSGAMIGNDSGIGHLASCLGLPTVTICRSKMTARFWQPGWGKNTFLCPSSWVPNLKGLRWRDRYWQKWISTSKVQKEFLDLVL